MKKMILLFIILCLVFPFKSNADHCDFVKGKDGERINPRAIIMIEPYERDDGSRVLTGYEVHIVILTGKKILYYSSINMQARDVALQKLTKHVEACLHP